MPRCNLMRQRWLKTVHKQKCQNNFLSHILEITLTILRGWKWMDVQSVNDVTSLNFAIQTGILLFLFALTLTDISTIYFEVSSVLCSWSDCDKRRMKNAFLPVVV